MHLEILVEDISGKAALEVLLPKILGDDTVHTFDVKAYKGIGRIPSGMKSASEANQRILLDQLPRVLQGYGKRFQNYAGAVIVVCDLDNKCLKAFRAELLGLLENCNPAPLTRFCIAIEEGEAWLLGDLEAVKAAYPKAKDSVLADYNYDAICGTWEVLADAVYPGGSKKLQEKGWQAIGAQKSEWAQKIVPHLQVERNQSPSFQYFCVKVRESVQQPNCLQQTVDSP